MICVYVCVVMRKTGADRFPRLDDNAVITIKKMNHFLDNDGGMSSKRLNLSVLVFLINLMTKVYLIYVCTCVTETASVILLIMCFNCPSFLKNVRREILA